MKVILKENIETLGSIGDIVKVYTMLGKEIKEIESNGERIIIPLAKGAIYIVRVANKTTKVVL